MCGRFVSASSPEDLANYFSASPGEALLEPSHNVAPSNDVYVVRVDGDTRRLDAFHWGLVPGWAKDPSIGNRMINARAETIGEKAVFRNAFRRRRCLVPADGFYEWAAVAGQKTKQPYFMHRRDGEPLAFAGLWEQWRRDDEPTLRSCTIITCAPNETLAPIHDRMPAILPASAWDEWLDPGNDDQAALQAFLVPAPPALLVVRPVSTEVNNVRNKGAHLIDEVAVPVPGEGQSETSA